MFLASYCHICNLEAEGDWITPNGENLSLSFLLKTLRQDGYFSPFIEVNIKPQKRSLRSSDHTAGSGAWTQIFLFFRTDLKKWTRVDLQIVLILGVQQSVSNMYV